MDSAKQSLYLIKKSNNKVFKEAFGDTLLQSGFIYKHSMFVRVQPGTSAIFVYFKTIRRVLYDISVSVISFASDPNELKELIADNAVSIWAFRAKHMDMTFDCRSIESFITCSKVIFDRFVLPELIRIVDCNSVLNYYRDFIDNHFSNKLHFGSTKIAAGLECKAYDYVGAVLKAWEDNLADYRRRVEAKHDLYYEQCVNRINLDYRKISEYKSLIMKNDDTQALEQYIDERVTYWDTLIRNRYPVFYKDK